MELIVKLKNNLKAIPLYTCQGTQIGVTMELNYTDGPEIPTGLGMALAQNLNAMNYFASLDNTGKQQVIDGTHSVRSKSEMKQYVSNLSEGNSFR